MKLNGEKTKIEISKKKLFLKFKMMLNDFLEIPDCGAPSSVDPYCLVLENSSWVSAAATLGPGAVVPSALSS